MKILAIDDDAIIRELLYEILTAIGYTSVSFASSGHEALEILEAEEEPFDCLLLDIQMPEMDGITLVSLLRSSVKYARTPILMITAMSDRKYVDNAFAAGATDYINKPFNIGELHARLKLIEDLVIERKQIQDRSTVRWADSNDFPMAAADTTERLHIEDVDSVIDYLSLENYMLQMSRASLFGNCVFGVAIKDSQHLFQGISKYEFNFAITDVAEAISDCLKPYRFFVAHAGGGDFACIRDVGRSFDRHEFEMSVAERLRDMELYYCEGRPMVIHLAASEPIQLDWRSSRSSVNALLESVGNAERYANSPAITPVQAITPLQRLFS